MFLEIFQKAFQLLFHPQKQEEHSTHYFSIYTGILALIPAVHRILDLTIIQGSILMSWNAIFESMLYWARIIVIMLLLSLILKLIFKEKFKNSTKHSSYALTPLMFSFVISIIPIYQFIGSIYGAIILLLGLKTRQYWHCPLSLITFAIASIAFYI